MAGTVVHQNYLEMEYENEFDIITLIYCDFGVLPSKDRALLLKKVNTALKPDGVFILDGLKPMQYKKIL